MVRWKPCGCTWPVADERLLFHDHNLMRTASVGVDPAETKVLKAEPRPPRKVGGRPDGKADAHRWQEADEGDGRRSRRPGSESWSSVSSMVFRLPSASFG
jgi:hypothetical protein